MLMKPVDVISGFIIKIMKKLLDGPTIEISNIFSVKGKISQLVVHNHQGSNWCQKKPTGPNEFGFLIAFGGF